jgi:hypothetical protein
MKSWANRNDYHRSVHQQLTASPNTVAPVLTDELREWLAQLSLLYGVPIEYLIPDPRMLPAESLRFFYLDRNWLDRMLDGALSVGVLSSREQVFNKAFFSKIYQQVDSAQRQLRSRLRNEKTSPSEEIGGTMTGLLLRSRLVSDYPGLEINAYDAQQLPLQILRMDRLSDSLLICLFQGVPTRVEFIQPSEGLHFGIENDVQTDETFTYLRGLGFSDPPGKYPAGEQLFRDASASDPVTARVAVLTGASSGVVDVLTTTANIESALRALPGNALKNPDTGVDKLTAGGFAIQMIVTASLQPYSVTAPPPNPPTDVQ